MESSALYLYVYIFHLKDDVSQHAQNYVYVETKGTSPPFEVLPLINQVDKWECNLNSICLEPEAHCPANPL